MNLLPLDDGSVRLNYGLERLIKRSGQVADASERLQKRSGQTAEAPERLQQRSGRLE
jgi:hypothetical protein